MLAFNWTIWELLTLLYLRPKYFSIYLRIKTTSYVTKKPCYTQDIYHYYNYPNEFLCKCPNCSIYIFFSVVLHLEPNQGPLIRFSCPISIYLLLEFWTFLYWILSFLTLNFFWRVYINCIKMFISIVSL